MHGGNPLDKGTCHWKAAGYYTPAERSSLHRSNHLTAGQAEHLQISSRAVVKKMSLSPRRASYLVTVQLSSEGRECCGSPLQKERKLRDCFDCGGSSAILLKLNNILGENRWIPASAGLRPCLVVTTLPENTGG